MKKSEFRRTILSCYVGYVTQAVVNNYSTLLFVMFQEVFSLSLSKISLLIAVNFGVQLITDSVSAVLVDKIGYRAGTVGAHFLCALGLALLPVLPFVMNPYAGLLLSVVLSGIGGGMIEVVISPIVEACPSDNKESAMSLLHSFYCWGQLGVVLISTLCFRFFGIGSWRVMSLLWAVIPLVNAFVFMRVPLNTLPGDVSPSRRSTVFRKKLFWVFVAMMLCAGASELTMSQWASAFAEKGLGVSKWVGDLLGPCMFALFMGCSRVFYGIFGEKIRLSSFMLASCAVCVLGYGTAVLAPYPLVSLVGCGICGLAVGIMWPGTYSMGVKAMPFGGTPMFALFALAGDMGCLSGPTLAGQLSARFNDNIRVGFAFAALFPLVMFFLTLLLRHRRDEPNTVFSG